MLPEFPPYLILELTKKCNFNCPYCYCVWHEFPSMCNNELSQEEWENIISYSINNGVKDFLLTGGEALLRNDIFSLIEYARRIAPNIGLTLFSNCSLLKDDDLLFLVKQEVHVCTSVQGLTTYGKMTGTGFDYHRLFHLLSYAKEISWPFAVNLTVTKTNLFEIPTLFSQVASAGAWFIQIAPMMLEGKARYKTDLVISRNEWEKLKKSIPSINIEGVKYQFCDEIICSCKRQPLNFSQYALPENECSAGKEFGVIGPNGKYRKCLHLYEEIDLSPIFA